MIKYFNSVKSGEFTNWDVHLKKFWTIWDRSLYKGRNSSSPSPPPWPAASFLPPPPAPSLLCHRDTPPTHTHPTTHTQLVVLPPLPHTSGALSLSPSLPLSPPACGGHLLCRMDPAADGWQGRDPQGGGANFRASVELPRCPRAGPRPTSLTV